MTDISRQLEDINGIPAQQANPNAGWAAAANPGGAGATAASATVAAATQPAAAAPAAPAAAAPAPTTTPTGENGVADATNQQSASALISSFLSSIPGLSTLDPSGILAGWVNSQVATLAGQGLDPSDIVSTIQSTINNPSSNPQALAIFNQLFPGYNQKITNGTSNTNGEFTGLSGYISYAQQLQAMASTAGIPGGLSTQTVGDMWANNVSSTEASSRITQGFVAANQAWTNIPGFATYMSQNFGLTQGALAGYFLDENNSLSDQTLQQNLNQGMVAGAAAEAGFGSLGQSQDNALAAFLASGNQNGLGGVGSVSSATANEALTSSLGNDMASASQMAQSGFEQALPGQGAGNPGVLSQNQILGAVEGNAGDVQAARLATGTRTAGTGGGGGAANSAQGVSGVGFGSQE